MLITVLPDTNDTLLITDLDLDTQSRSLSQANRGGQQRLPGGCGASSRGRCHREGQFLKDVCHWHEKGAEEHAYHICSGFDGDFLPRSEREKWGMQQAAQYALRPQMSLSEPRNLTQPKGSETTGGIRAESCLAST